MIHEYLAPSSDPSLESLGSVPIHLPVGVVFAQPSRWTTKLPTLAMCARDSGGFRSRTPRDGIHKYSGLSEYIASHVPNLKCACTRSYCAVFQMIMSEGSRHREGGGGVHMNRKRFSTESKLITLIGEGGVLSPEF